jgi:hypothetical protein
MKQIYGFKIENPNEWSDVFDDETRSPEYLISSACHMYYGIDGDAYIGFDVSLGLGRKKMEEDLAPFSKKLAIRRVL